MPKYTVFIGGQRDRGAYVPIINLDLPTTTLDLVVTDAGEMLPLFDLKDLYLFYDNEQGVEDDGEGEDYYSDDTWDFLDAEPTPVDEDDHVGMVLAVLKNVLEDYDDPDAVDRQVIEQFLTQREAHEAAMRIENGAQAYKVPLNGGTWTKPVEFSKKWGDENYVPVDLVSRKGVKAQMELFPVPRFARLSANWWGRLKDEPKVEFTGKTQDDVILTAAIFLAHRQFHQEDSGD